MSCKIVKLKDLCHTGKGTYGIPASAVPFSNDLYTYLRITDISDDGKLLKENLVSVDDVRAPKYLLNPGDIVFARTGNSTGRNYFYDGRDGKLVYAGFLIKFSIDAKKVNPLYIKYYCQSKKYYAWIQSFNTGSTRGNINAQTYAEMEVFLPDREQQDLLVDVLSPLDDKIELNNRINKNLEAQAQAIFKSWFVDFEPFRDGGFVDSELGPIPKGWSVGKLSDIGTIIGGATPSKAIDEYYTKSKKGIAWITPKDLSINKNKFISHGEIDITDLGYRNASTKLMPAGSVLFSSRAPIGYMAIADNELCTNQGFKSIIPERDIGTSFVYYTLKSNLDTIQSLGSGSTFKEVSGSVMKNLSILIPDLHTIYKFEKLCKSLLSKQRSLEYQNQTLADLRDTLLPKLMSGEIRVPLEV